MFSRLGLVLHSILRKARLAANQVFKAKTPPPESHAVSLQPDLSTTETPPPKSHAVSLQPELSRTESLPQESHPVSLQPDVFTTETLSPQSIAVSLPTEIVSLILSHLPPESVVAFGLTCRRFYPFVPSPPHLTEEARQILLEWLEKDTPSLYWCHRCNTLHTWCHVEDHGRNIVQYDRYCRKRAHYVRFPRPPHMSYCLTFSLARVAMNRHFYGDLHGPPLEMLGHGGTFPDYPPADGVLLTQSLTARIIGGELYLRASVQIHHDQGRARPLREHLDETGGETKAMVCHHVGIVRKPWRGLGVCSVRELEREPGSTDLFVPITGTLQSCRYCFTDYRVDVRWHPLDGSSSTPKGWVISVMRWHRLGGCRSPNDVKWNNFITDFVADISRPRFKSCGAGMVYRDWNGAAREDEAEDQAANAKFASSS